MKMPELLHRYGLIGIVRLARDVIITRIMFPEARIIRLPVYIRGRKYIKIGRGLTTGVGLRLDASKGRGTLKTLILGNNIQINDYVHIGAIEHVVIGDDVLIASRVFISDHNHGNYKFKDILSCPNVAPIERPLVSKSVIIGNRVWIGENVCILPGVEIGDGSIIGAGSVVTNSIPPNCIVVGNPAKVIKHFNFEKGTWEKI